MPPLCASILTCLFAMQLVAEVQGSILVRIQDYADVSPKRLSEATAVADRILGEAGVELQWQDCSPNREAAPQPVCANPPGELSILLRLVPDAMTPPGTTGECLGYSILPPMGFGSIVSVFVYRARRAAEAVGASRSSVLGHAIAHELAHLLLGSSKHNWRGLMRPGWGGDALLRATANPMKLTDQERRRIRLNLHKRIEFAQRKSPEHLVVQSNNRS